MILPIYSGAFNPLSEKEFNLSEPKVQDEDEGVLVTTIINNTTNTDKNNTHENDSVVHHTQSELPPLSFVLPRSGEQQERNRRLEQGMRRTDTEWKNDGWNPALFTRETGWFSDEFAGDSSAMLGMQCRKTHCSEKKVKYHFGVVQSSGSKWTDWIDQGQEANCPDHLLLSKIQRNNRKRRLKCSVPVPGSYQVDTTADKKTTINSDCPNGYYINGMKSCGGSNCDSIVFSCVKVKYATGQILAKYYNNSPEKLPWSTDLDEAIADETNYVQTISFPHQNGPFATSSFTEKLFARFEGYLTFPLPGEYELYIRVDGYAKLQIDGEIIYEGNPDVSLVRIEYSVAETNIQKYVQLDMVDTEGHHQLILEWQRPGDLFRSVIPSSYWSRKVSSFLFFIVATIADAISIIL